MPALILMYHDVSDDLRSISRGHAPYVLNPIVFRRQMEAVAESRVPVFNVTDWCSASKPRSAVVLTFDDGHVSNHHVVLPILREFGLKASFFITAGRIGKGDTMNWSQIRALHAAGMEIGSHTMTHRPPSTLDDRELRYELAESRRILEDGVGVAVISLSSPTGFFNPRMRLIAQEVGYRALCFGRIGLAPDNGDPFSLNRVAVKRGMSNRQFQTLLRLDRTAISCLRSKQWLRELVRGIMGVELYLQLRRVLIRTSSS